MPYIENEFTKKEEEKMEALEACSMLVGEMEEEACAQLDAAIKNRNVEQIALVYHYLSADPCKQVSNYSRKLKRLRTLTEILLRELTTGEILFWENCFDTKALLEKYLFLIFSLRRLNLAPAHSMLHEEAVAFLQKNTVSETALEVMVREEIL